MPERAFSTTTWGDDWFMPLSRDQRYLSMYLELNQHCNQAGVYHIRLETIAFEAKFGLEGLPELLASLPHIKWCPEHNIVWVKDFVKRQAKSPKFLTAAARCLEEIQDHGLVGEVLEYNLSHYRISIPYRYSTDAVSSRIDMPSEEDGQVSIPPLRVSIPPDTDTDARSRSSTGETGDVKGEKPGHNDSVTETAMESGSEETHEGSEGATATAEESALLGFLETLEGWRRSANDLGWLREFRQEYPQFDLSTAKACRDYHSGRVKPKHEGVWKNRFREWMKHEREFKKGDNATHQRDPGKKDYKGSIKRFVREH